MEKETDFCRGGGVHWQIYIFYKIYKFNIYILYLQIFFYKINKSILKIIHKFGGQMLNFN